MSEFINSGVKCAYCNQNLKTNTKTCKFRPCRCDEPAETISDLTFNAVKKETKKVL